MKTIEAMLRERVGLDPAALGSVSVRRAVRRRMKSLGMAAVEDYQRHLAGSPAEYRELVEATTVSETWFFRDPEALAALGHRVLEQWLPAHPLVTMRLLSVPCSSGEEPYSIVMALLDAGVPADRFHVDAADISTRALAAARRGVYGKNAFRSKDLGFRDRYFRAAKEGFVMNPGIRRLVYFTQGNLISRDFRPGYASYDVIFCRNLLIYFDREAQRKALEQIEKLLAPSGVLFLGPAEQPLAFDYGFVSAGLLLAFACRKEVHASATGPKPHPVRSAAAPQPSSTARASCADRFAASPDEAVQADLEEIQSMANAGRLADATDLCESHLRGTRTSAQGYYLLGLLRDARGDASAIDCYRKALYLEPNHYAALLQMALLANKNGDLAGARNFQRRAQRLQPNTGNEL